MTSTLTFPRLRELILAAAGEDETVTLDENATFESMGYDSLAFMETVSRIERTYCVRLPEDEVLTLRTPRALLDFVNDRIAGR